MVLYLNTKKLALFSPFISGKIRIDDKECCNPDGVLVQAVFFCELQFQVWYCHVLSSQHSYRHAKDLIKFISTGEMPYLNSQRLTKKLDVARIES